MNEIFQKKEWLQGRQTIHDFGTFEGKHENVL